MPEGVEFHEAANIFPMMTDEEAHGLLTDIKKNGLQEPVKFFEGKILDGRNRYLALLKLGIDDYEYVELADDDVDNPVNYVLSANLHRRQLTQSQRAMIGAKSKKYYEDKAKERQQEHGKTAPGRKKNTSDDAGISVSGTSRDAIGVAVGVDGKQVDQAKKILANGTPELIAATEAGKLRTETAKNTLMLSANEQRKVAASKNPQKTAQAAIRKHKEEKETLLVKAEVKVKGVGTTLAREAIDKLKRIPKNDLLRKRGFQIVTDWIKANK